MTSTLPNQRLRTLLPKKNPSLFVASKRLSSAKLVGRKLEKNQSFDPVITGRLQDTCAMICSEDSLLEELVGDTIRGLPITQELTYARITRK